MAGKKLGNGMRQMVQDLRDHFLGADGTPTNKEFNDEGNDLMRDYEEHPAEAAEDHVMPDDPEDDDVHEEAQDDTKFVAKPLGSFD